MDSSCVSSQPVERVAGCLASILFNCFKCFDHFKMTVTPGDLQADVLIFSGTTLPSETFNMRSEKSHSVPLISRYSLPKPPSHVIGPSVPVRGG
ncbi:hypothetical protein TNCV_418451 [Trichonephila clavipes]|nr:hypothetical protein TNCV_418451 [Trichonephila clavipes]